MQINKTVYMMIKSAVNKGICDIKENPKRGLDNLLELGAQFFRGRSSEVFFDTAHKELLNTDSPYYRLVENLVGNTQAALLCNIGMNLGYLSFSAGAKAIREIEKKEGFNVPWAILFDTRNWQDFNIDILAKTISQGKSLGQYCYIIFIDRKFAYLEQLLQVVAKKSKRTFVLLSDPIHVNEEMIETIHKSNNIFIGVDCGGDYNEVETAISSLKDNNCLYGGVSYNTDSADEEKISEESKRMHQLGLPFLYLIDENKRPLFQASGNQAIANIRAKMQYPVLPVDLYDEIAHLGGIISNYPCIVHVNADGTVEALSGEGESKRSEHSILDLSLGEILAGLNQGLE